MTKSGRRQKDFFISYTSTDRKWAEWIALVLKSDKHSTVIQSWDFGPGCNFILEMHKALLMCRRVLLVYSPAYFKSLYAQAEWVAALAQDVSGEERILLPVRVKRCAPAGLRRPIADVDLVNVAEDKAIKDLLIAARPPAAACGAKAKFPGKRARGAHLVRCGA